MTLLKVVSEKNDKNGKPYEDYFLAERMPNGEFVYVRVRAVFVHELPLLRSLSVVVPNGELKEKYVG